MIPLCECPQGSITAVVQWKALDAWHGLNAPPPPPPLREQKLQNLASSFVMSQSIMWKASRWSSSEIKLFLISMCLFVCVCVCVCVKVFHFPWAECSTAVSLCSLQACLPHEPRAYCRLNSMSLCRSSIFTVWPCLNSTLETALCYRITSESDSPWPMEEGDMFHLHIFKSIQSTLPARHVL